MDTPLDPSAAIYAEGTPEDRQRAREQWRRQRFLTQLARSNLRELQAATLERHPFSIVEDRTDGRRYKVRPDRLDDIDHTAGIIAYYHSETGPVLLEESRPQTRQGAEARQAARRARHDAPKAKPSWLRSVT